MEYAYYKLKCKYCGRKILVEVLLMGTDHNASIIATCADCLKGKIDSDFAKTNSAAKDITEWIGIVAE